MHADATIVAMGHDFLATIMNEDGNYSDAMMLSEDRAILRLDSFNALVHADATIVATGKLWN